MFALLFQLVFFVVIMLGFQAVYQKAQSTNRSGWWLALLVPSALFTVMNGLNFLQTMSPISLIFGFLCGMGTYHAYVGFRGSK